MSGKIHRAALLLAATCAIQPVFASDSTHAVAGKNGWVFSGFEQMEASETAATNTSIELIRRFNEVLSRNGVTMVLAMPPIKSRIYAENLPAQLPLSPFMASYYDSVLQTLRGAQVNAVDINSVFMNSPKRNADTPLYYRLDSHWSPSGALLAAQTIRTAIDANPTLKSALAATPERKLGLTLEKSKSLADARDLADRLPDGGRSLAQERMQDFKLSGAKSVGASLRGDSNDPLVALLGSSYSAAGTRFPDALRYTLQREILVISVNAVQGSWVGMEEYLMNDAFQNRRPKLLVWEMPERDLRAPPSYRYRDARYQSDNREWLMRASALAQSRCTPSSIHASIVAGGLAAGGAAQVQSGATADTSYVDISFDKPLSSLDYLSASMATGGSRAVVLEPSGEGENPRRITIRTAGDGAFHALRAPLPGVARGYSKLRIYPGRNSAFALKDVQVCRQPDNLLN
jgi:alginate O-acetyltransferase complex protein AlgJ